MTGKDESRFKKENESKKKAGVITKLFKNKESKMRDANLFDVLSAEVNKVEKGREDKQY